MSLNAIARYSEPASYEFLCRMTASQRRHEQVLAVSLRALIF